MRRTFYILLIAVALGGLGCSKKKTDLGGTPGATGTVPVTPIDDLAGAEKVALNASASALTAFGGWTVNNPTNVQLKVDMSDYGQLNNDGVNRYGGLLTISYSDDTGYGQIYTKTIKLTSGGNASDAMYNRWFEFDGKNVFHAFFEDDSNKTYQNISGGVILVIDETDDLGDGSSDITASGSVWYMNVDLTPPPGAWGPPPQPPGHCWFVELGPYDCRAFLNHDKVVTTSRLEPEVRKLSTGKTNGYYKLGTFTNLNLSKAFNMN